MTLTVSTLANGVAARRRGVAVGSAVAVAALGVLSVSVAAYALLSEGLPTGDPALGWVAELTFVVVGSVMALARPGNRVGWAVLAGGAAMAFGDAAVDLADWGLVNHPGAVSGAGAYAIAGAVARTAGWYSVTLLVPIWFPDGATLPGRWRLLPRLVAATMALGLAGTTFASHLQLNELAHWQNPLSSPALNAVADPMSGLSLLLGTVSVVLAVAHLVVRYRRSDRTVRRQIGLYAAAAILPVVAAPLGVAGIAGGWIFYATTIPLPICVGFAILGRGLYDLPTAANKALVWAALSGAVLAIYAIIVGVAGTALDSRGGRWFPWVAAAVVAVSITPLRDALQRSVNRVTYGQWDDPYQVLADLGRRLEASADPDRLLREVTTQLTASLGLRDVAILDSTGRTLMGRPRAGASLLPLVAFGRAVGTLTYTSTGVLRGGDDTLLHDLAAHLGGLLYAHNVTADLRRARERLVLAREEERRRLRRDLHDGLGPALAGHLLRLEVATDALPATSAIRTQLDALRGELQGTVEDVRRVVEGLRPPALDEIGLAGAIEQAIGRLTNRGIAGRSGASGAHGPAAEVTIAPLPALSAAVEVAAYRIVSEAVTNVVRHAAATRCRVTVATDGQALRIEVQDDGGGIRPGSRRGHGLDTMRERAEELGGTLTVSSPASGFARTGTAVTAVLPAALPEPGESA